MNFTGTSRKLVFITSRFPFPIEKGDKLRAYYQLRDLSRYWEIHLIALSDVPVKEAHKAAVAPFCKSIHIFRLFPLMSYLRVILGLFGHRPFQVYYFNRWYYRIRARRLLEEIKPDHIFAQLIRTAEYVKNYHDCPKTLDYMDVLSAGVQKRIPLAPAILKPFYESEWRRLLRYEHVIYYYFEHHTIISEQDRNQVPHTDKLNITVIPNGVDEYFLNYDASSQEPEYDICFVGNLSYAPNIEAVKFIGNVLIPEFERRGQKVKVLISGANPSAELQAFRDTMTITGWVDDIRSAYARSKVFIAPMFIGTGLQNKLLEALALGMPCVSTPLAQKPLNCGEDIVATAESASEFVDIINEQLASWNDNEKRKVRQEFVRSNFNWPSVNAKLSDLLSSKIK